jgi:O-antigen biosynthesis protein
MTSTPKETVFFACGTEYHLLIAFILSKTTYRFNKKILFIYNEPRIAQYIHSAKEIKAWDEVHLITAKDSEFSSTLDIPDLSTLHFFTFGYPVFNQLFSRMSQKGVKIILTDEGTLSYHPARFLSDWLDARPQNAVVAEGFSLAQIAEYYLGDPRIFCESTNVPLRQIPFDDFIELAREDKQIGHDLEHLFLLENPQPLGKKEFVFFQQNATNAKLLPSYINEIIDESIIRLSNKHDTYIKAHPSLAIHNAIEGPEGLTKSLNGTPWELNLLLSKIHNPEFSYKNTIFISLNSSAMHNSIFMNPDGVYIYLHRIMYGYSDKRSTAMDDLVDRLVENYPRTRIYRPSNWNELQANLVELSNQLNIVFDYSSIFALTPDKRMNTAGYPIPPSGHRPTQELKHAIEQGKWDLAEKIGANILSHEPSHVEAAYFISIAYINTQRAETAKNILNKIIERHPNHLLAHRALVFAHAFSGAHDQVVEVGTRLLPIFPRDMALRKFIALALYRLQRFEDAFWMNTTMLNQEPNDLVALGNLVSISIESRIFIEDAELFAQKTVALAQQDPRAEQRLGLLQLFLGDYPAAEKSYRRALEKASPEPFPEAKHGLAMSLIDQKRPAEARSVFESIIKETPQFTSALADYYDVLKEMGEFERVLPTLPPATAEQLKQIAIHSPGMPYSLWIEAVETPNQPNEASIESEYTQWKQQPLISVLISTYDTNENHLRACIDSVRAQSYPNWELCIADDASPNPHVTNILREYEAVDTRIRVVYRAQNEHKSQALNSALEIALGEFVALLDHNDQLSRHALYFMAAAIQTKPDIQVLYSDEDKIDAQGKRSDPHFKSDWNPDLFYSQNYVSHLGVYRRDLLNRIGGFRTGLEDSLDQDLLLRCLPHVQANQIIHIPHVLYHWRMVEGSTALAPDKKSYTTEAGIKALRDYFTANGPVGIAIEAGQLPNTYHLHWPIPEPSPLVSLLIPTRDAKTVTEVAVRSILDKTTYANYEILILDNGSTEPQTLAWFDAIQREDARVTVLRYDHPFNYSAINNFGVEHAKGSVIGLINNDIEVISPEWLTEMVSHCCREDIGCVGAKLYYSNDTVQHGGVIIGLGGVAAHSHKHYAKDHPGYFGRLKLTQNLSAVTAACLLVRKEIYTAVGGLDETHLKVAFNDVDFCLKVREAGYRNLWTPYAELYHHESLSRGSDDTAEKQARALKEVEFMQHKWNEILQRDPYYNPNLTYAREDFSIAARNEVIHQAI